jgi:hypothetical protein
MILRGRGADTTGDTMAAIALWFASPAMGDGLCLGDPIATARRRDPMPTGNTMAAIALWRTLATDSSLCSTRTDGAIALWVFPEHRWQRTARHRSGRWR